MHFFVAKVVVNGTNKTCGGGAVLHHNCSDPKMK